MAILIIPKSIEGTPKNKESFEMTIYDGKPVHLNRNVYELPYVSFTIDYINSLNEVVRLRYRKDSTILPNKEIVPTSEMQQDAMRAVFNAKYIDQRGLK